MINDFDLKYIERFRASVQKQGKLIGPLLHGWTTWHDYGRTIVGWKRISLGYANWQHLSLSLSRVVNFKPLSTLEILRKNIRKLGRT